MTKAIELSKFGNLLSVDSAAPGSEKIKIDGSSNLDLTGGGNLILNTNKKLFFEGDADDDLNALYRKESENTTILTARFNIANIIDANNDDTTSFWSVRHNGTTLNGSGELLRVTGTGRMGLAATVPETRFHMKGAGVTEGALIENNHNTTTISGNTAKGAFPHAITLYNSNNQGGETAGQNTNLVSIGFGCLTDSAHSNAAIVGHSMGSAGSMDLAFYTENNNTIGERLRITSVGEINVPYGVINLGTAGSSSGHLNSTELMTFNIDTDNNSSNRYFSWSKNANSSTGTEMMRFNEDARLCIGGDLVPSANHITLKRAGDVEIDMVATSGSGNNFRIKSDTGGKFTVRDHSAGADRITINGSGDVGIGQTSPQGDLHIGNISGNKDIVMHSANNGTATLRFREGGSNASGFNEYSIGMVGNRNAMTVNGQGSGEIIAILGDSGHVGVGNTAPSCKLAITDTTTFTAYNNQTPSIGSCVINLTNNPSSEAANNHATIQFNVNGGSHNRVCTISAVAESASDRQTSLTFCTDDTGGRSEKLRITGMGNILAENTLFTSHVHQEYTGFGSGNSTVNYLLVCPTNTTNARFVGTIIAAREAGTSGVGVGMIDVALVGRHDGGVTTFDYTIRSMSTKGTYAGPQGQWCHITHSGVEYWAIRFSSPIASMWGTRPGHCQFYGVINNCTPFGRNTNSHTLTDEQIFTAQAGVHTFLNTHIGINEVSPDNMLHITKDSSATYSANETNTTNAANSLLKLENIAGTDNTGANYYTGIQFSVASGANSYAEQLYRRTGNNSGAFSWKARNGATSYPNLMELNSAGVMTLPHQPVFSATGLDTHRYSNTHHNVDLHTWNYVVQNGSHFNNSNGRFTAPTSGKYLFIYTSMFTNAGNTDMHNVIVHNGTIQVYSNNHSRGGSAEGHLWNDTTVQIILQLSANDYVTARSLMSGGGTNTYLYGTGTSRYGNFSGFLIG